MPSAKSSRKLSSSSCVLAFTLTSSNHRSRAICVWWKHIATCVWKWVTAFRDHVRPLVVCETSLRKWYETPCMKIGLLEIFINRYKIPKGQMIYYLQNLQASFLVLAWASSSFWCGIDYPEINIYPVRRRWCLFLHQVLSCMARNSSILIRVL